MQSCSLTERAIFNVLVLVLVILLVSVSPARAQEELPYTVRFQGIEDPSLWRQIDAATPFAGGAAGKVSSALRLRRMARGAAETMTQALRALGYIDATVTFETAQENAGLQVVFTAAAGMRYALAAPALVANNEAGAAVELPDAAKFGLVEGAPAASSALRGAESSLLTWLRQQGYPYPALGTKRYIANQDTKTLRAELVAAAGPFAEMGEVEVSGLTSVRERVVLQQQQWEPGTPYDERLVSEYRNLLYRRGLFSVVRVRPGEELDADGKVPILVDVEEGKHRTLKLGLRYHTVDGPGLLAGWEDRNLWGRGQPLRVEAQLAELTTELKTSFEMPYFKRRDQALSVTLAGGLADTDAFQSRYARGQVWISRKPKPRPRLGMGLGLRYSLVESKRRVQEDYLFLSTPLEAEWDGRDVPANPTQGWRWLGHTEPFVEVLGFDRMFLKLDGTFAYYVPLSRDRDWVLASRLRLGAMVGETLEGIPEDLRFYAGGGGSVRGYSYQHVGPLDRDGDPTGGRSLLEIAFELRKKLSDSLGVAAFLDGGTVGEGLTPPLGDLQWGAGAGVRLFTPLGPLRVDLAVPLDKRGDDRSFQFYISIGHAF